MAEPKEGLQEAPPEMTDMPGHFPLAAQPTAFLCLLCLGRSLSLMCWVYNASTPPGKPPSPPLGVGVVLGVRLRHLSHIRATHERPPPGTGPAWPCVAQPGFLAKLPSHPCSLFLVPPTVTGFQRAVFALRPLSLWAPLGFRTACHSLHRGYVAAFLCVLRGKKRCVLKKKKKRKTVYVVD